jgi:peroxiredoxin
MKTKILMKAFALMLPIFLLTACSSSLGIASAAPDLDLRDMNGKTVKLSDYKGKVIILVFSAPWSPQCKEEIPDFIALQKQYGEQGFVLIGVALSPAADVKPFAERMGINYLVLISDSYASSVYGPIRSIPTTFVIDKEFKIAKKYIGFKPKEVFEADIKELLAKEAKGN